MDSGQGTGEDADAFPETEYTRITNGEGDLEQHRQNSDSAACSDEDERILSSDVEEQCTRAALEESPIVDYAGQHDDGGDADHTDSFLTLRSIFLSRRYEKHVPLNTSRDFQIFLDKFFFLRFPLSHSEMKYLNRSIINEKIFKLLN